MPILVRQKTINKVAKEGEKGIVKKVSLNNEIEVGEERSRRASGAPILFSSTEVEK